MRKTAISLLLILFLNLSPVSVQAENTNLSLLSSVAASPTPIEYTLPFPGILPDNPLYSFKVLRDRILLFFTKDPVRLIHLKVLMSDKRLVMGELLWEKGNYNLSIDTLTKGEKYLLEAAIAAVDLKKRDNLPPGLKEKVDLAIRKHEELISKLSVSSTDESYKKRIADALGVNHQASQQITSVK